MPDPPPGKAEQLETVNAIFNQLEHEVSGHDGHSDIERVDTAALATRRQLQRLVRTTRSMIDEPERTGFSLDLISSELSCLTRLCDQKFVTFSYSHIPAIWRATYIDIQLLKACFALISSSIDTAAIQQHSIRLCIRDLDLALIIAGAASLGKDQYCHGLIPALQALLLESDCVQGCQTQHQEVDHEVRRKRRRTTLSSPLNNSLKTNIQADSSIRECSFDQAPSFMHLAGSDSKHHSEPFVIRKFAQAAAWPAVQSHTREESWASIQHLLQVAGPARVVPVEVGANDARQNWGQDIMLWSDFLLHCQWDRPPELDRRQGDNGSMPTGSVLYMAQHDLSSQFPALQRDYMLPDYVYTSPPPPRHWPQYRPPASSDGVTTNLWIGPAGTVSPPHFDPYYNCFVQAVGYKEVWAAPPHCCPHAAKTPSLEASTQGHVCMTSATESSIAADATPHASITDSFMANTSSVDVFDTVKAIPASNRAAALQSTLGPGDLLFMPPGWWHSLRSLTRSFSVSMWF